MYFHKFTKTHYSQQKTSAHFIIWNYFECYLLQKARNQSFYYFKMHWKRWSFSF